MDSSSQNLEAPPPVPESRETSLVARLLNIVASPGEVFDEIKPRAVSTGNWLIPTVLVAIFGILSVFWTGSLESVKRQQLEMQEAVFQKVVESGKMTQAQADQQQGAEAMGRFKTIGAAIGTPIFSFLGLFFSALVVWLGGIVLGERFKYMRAVEVAGLVGIISALGIIVKTLLIVVKGSLFAGPTPALFVKDFDPMNTWHGALATLDVFMLWAFAVQAFGLAKMSGVSFGKAAVWIFGVWLVIIGGLFAVGLIIRRMMGF